VVTVKFFSLDPETLRYGIAEQVAPLVTRVTANNPSKFTYFGTGTYIVGDGDVVVIDPGPQLDSHREALSTALEGSRVTAILVTHCHADHSPLAAWLTSETGAPTVGFGPHQGDTWDIGADLPSEELVTSAPPFADGSAATPPLSEEIDREFTPAVVAATGDAVAAGAGWSITALHTPGHTSNHMCFVLDDGNTRTLFSGDHVMGWSTSVIGPPDGDMRAYLESLSLVADGNYDVAIPTHGPPILGPTEFVNDLIGHRLQRERQILEVVRSGLDTISAMVEVLYADVRRELHKPARRSVLAHLVKLADDDLVAVDGDELRPRLDSTYVAT